MAALGLLAAVTLAGPLAFASETAAVGLPPLPRGWPVTLELGLSDGPGGAARLRASGRFAFRYQYLAGGANTGQGWATWNPNGAFATLYIGESLRHRMIPVFSYYMLRQSAPGFDEAEAIGIHRNLQTTATMRAYYADLKLFLRRAGAFPGHLIVLHVGPDLWGYLQRRSVHDDVTLLPVKVAATGLPELAGLPNTASGFARAIVRLRDLYAPNVRLAYHLSIWGTGEDIAYTDP
ncbi:MAG TPA: hypothetical protein VGW35_27035, partial [Methylomirabilota bacterium]|nr:hypothetical protein [Methylomirabilota bacterium]